MSKTILVTALAGVALAAGVLMYTSGTGQSALPPSDPTDRALVAQGRPLYANNCAQCHGKRLEGEDADWRRTKENGQLYAPPHDPSGHTWHHPDGVLVTIIREGGQAGAPPGFISGMPAYGTTLSDAEIGAVLAFIKASWPKNIQARQAAMTQEAQK